MNRHLHVSTIHALVIFCYIVIFGFMWRAASAALTQRGSEFGKAMAYIY